MLARMPAKINESQLISLPTELDAEISSILFICLMTISIFWYKYFRDLY